MKINNKINNKHKSFFAKYRHYIMLILVFIVIITSISFASNIIYQSSAKETKSSEEISHDAYSNPYYMETTIFEPSAEVIEETNAVRVADNLKKFGEYSSKFSKGIITMEDREDQPLTADSIKYIRHTQSITIVSETSYIWDQKNTTGQWMLNIFDQNVQHQAKNGFYLVGGKTYYFDSDGYMYVGKMMDERDTVYIFAETGELIYKDPS